MLLNRTLHDLARDIYWNTVLPSKLWVFLLSTDWLRLLHFISIIYLDEYVIKLGGDMEYGIFVLHRKANSYFHC